MSDCRNGGRAAYERPAFEVVEMPDGARRSVPVRPRWTPTSVDMSQHFDHVDTSLLRLVVIKGVRYVRMPEYEESCEVVE